MTEESRLREIHHSLSCLTPKLFTSAIFMVVWGWQKGGMFGDDNEYSMNFLLWVHLFLGFKDN